MQILEKSKEGWNNAVSINTDPYGACIMQFAETWANAMESKLAKGKTIPEIAKQTSKDTDALPGFGITGFMYGAAVSMLAKYWAHGEELRHWHNLDTQISDEGERLNKSDGVLNPALLNIRVK